MKSMMITMMVNLQIGRPWLPRQALLLIFAYLKVSKRQKSPYKI